MARPRAASSSPDPNDSLAFLLAQVGAHASARFADRMAPLGLTSPQVGILQVIQRADGLSQQALGEKLGMYPSRLVAMIDDLETRGWVERRDNPADRRSYALYLTDAGRALFAQVVQVAQEHQDDLCAALDAAEQAQLAEFLRRIAAQQQLTPGVHPAFRRFGGQPKSCD